MGALRRNTTYWPSSDLKADADFPASNDITIGANYMDCANLSLNALRTLLNASASELYDLCNLSGTFVKGGETGKINAWARYKPGQTAYNVSLPVNCYDNPTFTYTAPGGPPSGSHLGYFAGYNHNEETRPVYWGAPHQTEQYVVWTTIAIKNGLMRGKLCPILSSDVEDETYWSRVKVQAWLRVNSGSYSLISTSDYVNLSEVGEDGITLFTMGAHGETPGNTYTLCLRPVYMDSDGVTPLAVCEGGVEILTYRMAGESDYQEILAVANASVTSDNTTNSPHTTFFATWDIVNSHTDSLELYVRLRAKDNDDWFDWTYEVGTGKFVIPGSGSLSFNNISNVLGDTLYDGTFRLDCLISIDGSTWINIGTLDSAVQHWQSI